MGIWLHAEIVFKEDVFEKTKTSPVNIVKAAFEKHGLSVNKPYSEVQIAQATRCGNVDVSICNSDCYVDVIHNTFKYLTKQKDKTRCLYIEIDRHYY